MIKKAEQSEIERIADGLLVNLRGELGLPDVIAERWRKEQPILVKDIDGNPSYWLVPVASGDRLGENSVIFHPFPIFLMKMLKERYTRLSVIVMRK